MAYQAIIIFILTVFILPAKPIWRHGNRAGHAIGIAGFLSGAAKSYYG